MLNRQQNTNALFRILTILSIEIGGLALIVGIFFWEKLLGAFIIILAMESGGSSKAAEHAVNLGTVPFWVIAGVLIAYPILYLICAIKAIKLFRQNKYISAFFVSTSVLILYLPVILMELAAIFN